LCRALPNRRHEELELPSESPRFGQRRISRSLRRVDFTAGAIQRERYTRTFAAELGLPLYEELAGIGLVAEREANSRAISQ
jgi:hypothetical protein